ncbi:MAG: hypothetical protein HY960_02885 [Ignavibacteriae bacterium]|nr:hypothetical protein [Ignavibacteriota bacterium]
MGIVKEPKGVDFYVVNRELSSEERRKISEYIEQQKKGHRKKYSYPTLKQSKRKSTQQ